MAERETVHEGKPDVDLSLRIGRVAAPLREQVAQLLRDAILDFRLKPGQRLIERELIEQTGVSRTTIREVLRELTAEGLIATIPQRGAIVMVPSAKEAADIYEVRATLEGLAAHRFATRASDSQIEDLRRAYEEIGRMSGRTADIDVQTLLQVKDRFYDILLAGSGNATIRSTLETLRARVRVLRATSLSQPDRFPDTLREIGAIVDAVEARDPDAAAAAAAEHVTQAGRSGLAGLAAFEPGTSASGDSPAVSTTS